ERVAADRPRNYGPVHHEQVAVPVHLASVRGYAGSLRGRHVAATQRMGCDKHSKSTPGSQWHWLSTCCKRHRDMDIVERVERTERALWIPVEARPGSPEHVLASQRELAVCGVDRLAEPGNHVAEIGEV